MKVAKIVKMSAVWCAPCRVFAKTFHEVEGMEEYKDIEFKEVDIENDDDGEMMAGKYQVRSIPTTVILDESGEAIYKLIGNISKSDFIQAINDALKK